MNEIKTLPIFLFSTEQALPGITAHLGISDSFLKSCIDQAEVEYNNQICMVFKKAEDQEVTNIEDLLPVGMVGTIINKTIADDLYEVDIVLENRAELLDVNDIIDQEKLSLAEVRIFDDDANLSAEELKVFNIIKTRLKSYGSMIMKDNYLINHMISDSLSNKSMLCDIIFINLLTVETDIKDFITDTSFYSRLVTLLKYIELAIAQVEIDNTVELQVKQEIDKDQKEYYLRKKLRVIQEDLGDVDKASADADELREKIKAKGMPEKTEKLVLKELKRYQSTSSASPESTMIRAYLDLMVELPWKEETEDTLDITAAKAKLDETHFGLEKVKDRILEYLGVKLYTGKNPQTILCLAGPPGVGKTTLAKSISEALGRKFVKQSLGGVKDEAEIRGHRRTYLGALPGRIINGIKEAGVTNPVFLLDEIDKLGADYKGDPSASLLEVLDPAQNVHFMDHYTEVEYDLSKVMFICTANELDKVPAPLRDRMEIIELSSYTELEKFQIAKNYVIKKSLEKNGLEKEKFEITDDAIKYLIKYYTREAGARQLERCMDSLVRKSIKKILAKETEVVHIDETMITEMLGKKLFDFNDSDKEDLVGVVNGLAYTQAGGDTLQIEVQLVKGKGNVKLTGKLGDVMKESAEVAHTWVMAHAADYSIDSKMFEDYDVHIHVPEGATPKDGPSAGVTMTTAILSAFTNRLVHHDLGMTGEVTLRGRVLPIGGLKEKSIAAYRTGLKRILIPQENIKDLEDIPQEVKEHLEIIPVSKVTEVISYALI